MDEAIVERSLDHVFVQRSLFPQPEQEIDGTAAVFVALDHLPTVSLARELKKGDVCQYEHDGLSLVLCMVVGRELEVVPCRVGKERDDGTLTKMLSKQGLDDARQTDSIHGHLIHQQQRLDLSKLLNVGPEEGRHPLPKKEPRRIAVLLFELSRRHVSFTGHGQAQQQFHRPVHPYHQKGYLGRSRFTHAHFIHFPKR
jgi:hypothetical protein